MTLIAIPLSLLMSGAPVAAEPPATSLFGKELPARVELTDEEKAQRRQEFLQHLEDNNLIFTGDRILTEEQALGIQTGPALGPGGWEDPPHYATIFLNFFGGALTSGTNAAEGESGCAPAGGVNYPAFASAESHALAMIQVFEAAMEPYAVRIAFEDAPPKHLPYSMVMMGGQPQDVGMDAGILGVSCSSDCGDVWWRDTTYAFTEESSSSLTLGNTALQEAAHAFGLDHIDGTDHIMYPLATPGAKTWANECTTYNDSTGGISCTFVHEAFCPDGGMQNSDAELMAFFGPNAPDVEPPVVNIISPEDGLEVPEGTDIGVEAEITDDNIGMGWRLRLVPEEGEELEAYAYQFETTWNLSQLPAGAYTIFVEAIDHDMNEGSDEVTVFIGVDAPMTTGNDESDSGESGNEEESGGSEGSGGTGEQDDGGDKGCGCTAAPSSSWLGMLFLLGFVRRRRA